MAINMSRCRSFSPLIGFNAPNILLKGSTKNDVTISQELTKNKPINIWFLLRIFPIKPIHFNSFLAMNIFLYVHV